MQILDRLDIVGPVDRQRRNDFCRRPQNDIVVGAVRSRRREQVPTFRPNPLGLSMRDRREQHELAGGNVETLLADAALTQQHPLPAVQQRVHHRAPLLEREHGGGLRHRAVVNRRSGGEVFGGWRRAGSASNSRAVVAATSATASSKASALAGDGWVMPLTLRTY